MANGTPTAAAIYARISKDSQGKSLGVERQKELCEKLAAEKGWPVAATYEDNDLSAYSGKPRPGYEAMCEAIESGDIDGVLCVDQDRLTRYPKELETFMELADEHGVALANVSGDIDLSTSDGRFRARIMGAVARQESEKKAERVRRQKDQSAKNGWWQGGRRPYGYRSSKTAEGDSTLDIIPEEAEIVRELARRILAGESPRLLAIELNERCVPTAGGREWRGDTIRRTLRAGSVAGLRTHRGEIVGDANWPAILDRSTWEQVGAVLDGRGKTKAGRPSNHLLTGVLKCSKCDGTLYYRKDRYVCQPQPENDHCGGTSITAKHLEEFIAKLYVGIAGRLGKVEVSEPEPVSDEIEELEGRMERLSVMHHVDGKMSEREYLAARDGLEAKLTELRERLSESVTTKWETIDPEKAGELWAEASIEERRLGVQTVIDEIVVLPGKRGPKGLDLSRLDIKWQEQASTLGEALDKRLSQPSV